MKHGFINGCPSGVRVRQFALTRLKEINISGGAALMIDLCVLITPASSIHPLAKRDIDRFIIVDDFSRHLNGVLINVWIKWSVERQLNKLETRLNRDSRESQA